MHTRSIALIGLSGVGKSTLGRELAANFGLPLLDTDALIVATSGQTVAALFAAYGESVFRDREAAALAEALKRGPAIIATGGGVVLREENRTLLRQHCYVVWLDAPSATLAERLRGHNEVRPLLADPNVEDRLEALRQAREPLYAEIANLQIDARGQTAAIVANVLRHFVKERP